MLSLAKEATVKVDAAFAPSVEYVSNVITTMVAEQNFLYDHWKSQVGRNTLVLPGSGLMFWIEAGREVHESGQAMLSVERLLAAGRGLFTAARLVEDACGCSESELLELLCTC